MSLFRAAALYLALCSSLFNKYLEQSHSQIELDIFASLWFIFGGGALVFSPKSFTNNK